MSGKDLTYGSISSLMARLALPIFAIYLLQGLFAVVDLFFVGFLGPAPLAGLGISLNAFFLVFALGQAIGIGALAMLSQAYGARRHGQVPVIFQQCVWLTFFLGGLFWALSWYHATWFIGLFTDDGEVLRQGEIFFRIYAATFLTQLALTVFNFCWRAIGDFITPTLLYGASFILNIALDPLLIFGLGPVPPLGIAGAAYATVAAQGLMCLVFLWLIFRGRGAGLIVMQAPFRLDWRLQRRLLRIGIPSSIQFLLFAAGLMAVFHAMEPFGGEATAGVTVGFRIIYSAVFPTMAISVAVGSLVGQNFGARKFSRVKATILWGMAFTFILLTVEYLAILANPEFWAGLFTDQPGVIAIAANYLLIAGLVIPLTGCIFVATFAAQGMGRTVPPMMTQIVRFTVLMIGLSAVSLMFPGSPKAIFWTWSFSVAVELGLLVGVLAIFWRTVLRNSQEETKGDSELEGATQPERETA